MGVGGARTNPALGLPFTSTPGIPSPNPGSTHWWKVEDQWGGGQWQAALPSVCPPYPSPTKRPCFDSCLCCFSVSRAGLGARVLQGVCRGYRENETQGTVASVEPRPQSFWGSQAEGRSSKGWILGPGDTGQGLRGC